MAPPCKNIKYKERRRRSKPVVKTERLVTPCNSPESNSRFSIPEDLLENLMYGEGDYEEPELERPKPPINQIWCLRYWLQKQRFLPQELSDDFLGFFLTASGYNLEEAERRLERYFHSRMEPSYLFRDRDPLSPENMNILRKLYVLPMPDTTKDGRKIILMGLVEQILNYNPLDHLKILAMVFDLLIWEQDFGFGVYDIVLDGRGFQCPQLLENKVHNHRTIKNLVMDTIPGSLRSFYLLYPPPYVANVADNRDGIWITVVKSKQEMIRHLPADILPLEYGGNLGHLGDLLEQWELHLVESSCFFLTFEKRMMLTYEAKLCYEQELSTRGKNWVQEMKLVADEWEYKIQYYERMKNFKPPTHPAFRPLRKLNKPKEKTPPHPMSKCWKMAKEEEAEAKLVGPNPNDMGFVMEKKLLQLQAEREREMASRVQPPILELKICYY